MNLPTFLNLQGISDLTIFNFSYQKYSKEQCNWKKTDGRFVYVHQEREYDLATTRRIRSKATRSKLNILFAVVSVQSPRRVPGHGRSFVFPWKPITSNLLQDTTMKFCKNLQRVVDISDPEWAPYWPNYKMLKVRYFVNVICVSTRTGIC